MRFNEKVIGEEPRDEAGLLGANWLEPGCTWGGEEMEFWVVRVVPRGDDLNMTVGFLLVYQFLWYGEEPFPYAITWPVVCGLYVFV